MRMKRESKKEGYNCAFFLCIAPSKLFTFNRNAPICGDSDWGGSEGGQIIPRLFEGQAMPGSAEIQGILPEA